VPEGTIVATVFATDQDVSKSTGIVPGSSRAGGNADKVVSTPDSITSNYLAYFIVDGNEKGHFKVSKSFHVSLLFLFFLDIHTQPCRKLAITVESILNTMIPIRILRLRR